ncbi:MAG TPA: hypothetical protein VFS21_20280 [Roseiflexaceae bacterium]|nr:hypothetical protein [Roseiflexaceae bacterium]
MPDRSHCSELRSAHHQAADWRTFDLSLVAGRVYAVLCALLPLDVATAVSQTEIARVARLSQRHVGRALDELADAGLITRVTSAPGLPQFVTLLPLDPVPATAPATPPAAPPPATVTSLLRAYFASQPVGAEIVTTVRQLAQAIRRPHAGGISPALDRMEQGGEITRTIRDGRTVIRVRCLASAGVDHRDPPPQHPALPLSRITMPSESDLPPDRDPPSTGVDQPACMEHDMFHEQQQQHGAGARESLPEDLTATEWALLRQHDPTYDAARLRADLATLASRPDVHSPLGLIVAALRRREPLWGRDELRTRNAAVAAQHAPPDAAPRPGRHTRPRSAPAAPAAEADPVRLAPHGALWDLLLLLMPDADLVDWLCEGLDLEVQDDATVLHCRDADRQAVAGDLRGLLVDALRDLGLPDVLQILSAQPTVPTSPSEEVQVNAGEQPVLGLPPLPRGQEPGAHSRAASFAPSYRPPHACAGGTAGRAGP